MRKKVTIRDIADKAGVSRSAAWAALNPNNKIRVSDETRIKIQSIATELNFRPNMIAKGLVCKKSFLLGLVFNRQASLYALSIIDSIHKECAKHNYSLIVYPVSSLEEERHSLKLAVDRQVDGILTYPFLGQNDSNNKDLYDNIVNSGIPLVQLIFPLSSTQPCFGHDFYFLGKTATEYLLERGHKKIVLVTDTNYRNKIGGMMCHGHSQGYKEVMQKAELPTRIFTYQGIEGGFGSGDATYQIAENIINSSERPTAVVCSSNYAALGLIKRWEELGIKTPDDISIFGCTNNLGLPQTMMPRLTTFESCYDKIGSWSVQCCLNLSNSEISGHKIRLNVSEGNTVRYIK